MPIDVLRELDAIAISMPVEKGSFVFSSGDPARAAYVVRSGRIALIWPNSNEVYPMDTFGQGTIIALPAALNGKYSATARAVEKSELGFVPADRVMDILRRNSTYMHATLKLLALEVARMREMVAGAPEDNGIHLVKRSGV